MSKWIAIYRRELSYFFNSATAYVVITMFVLFAGYFFYNLVAFFNLASAQAMQNPVAASRLSLTAGVLQPFFGNLSVVMLFFMPALTMRLLSEERRTGTAELLFTYPISDWDAIIGKFLATLTVFAVMLGLTLVFPAVLTRYATPEWGAVVAGYAGLLLVGMAFIAIGIFFSSLTDSQIVAFILTIGFLLLFLIIGWVAPFVSQSAADILRQLSILEHLDNFSKGIIDTNDVVYYFNLSILFLFLCSRVLESNRWRS